MIDSSGIRKVFDLAAKIDNPINLSIGLPDFDVPDEVKDAAIKAIKGGKNRYTLTAGIPALREEVREYYRKRQIPFEDVLIASGTSGALMLVFLALLDPGDEVLVPDPYFVIYAALIKYLGAKVVPVNTYPDFHLTREALEAAWTPKTKLLILNSPGNPSGVVYSEAECRMAAQFAEERGIEVLSDEIYEPFCYEGEFVPPSRFFKAPITINGLSKSVSMTGWRLGWVAGPAKLIKAMTDVQQYTFVCAPSIAQEAALVGIHHDMTAAREDYKKRRDLIYEGLVNAGYRVRKPGGAFYIFPEAPGGDASKFVDQAIANKLLIVPGNVFSTRNTNFRISYAASRETILRGIEVLEKLAKQFGTDREPVAQRA